MKAELNMQSYTPETIARITGGVLTKGQNGAERIITNVCTDSREVSDGSLFTAIVGEKTDGHAYINDAFAGGASCVLAQRIPENWCGSGAIVVVPDVIHALGTLAGEYRDHASARVVAVTGSVGKTTTKEFIAAVLSSTFRTHKTEGNHNNELGLAMTMFTLQKEDEISVLEMGMSNPGEIERLSQLAKPDIAVITNIGTSHLASLGTRENICRAKMEITAGMKPDGKLILNGDEPLLCQQAGSVTPEVFFISIGTSTGNFRAVNLRTLDNGMVYDMICCDQALTNIRIPALGQHNVYNSLAAYAVGYLLGMPENRIRDGLTLFRGADMRQKIYSFHANTIIEDCYNASPESMRAALDVLAAVAARQNAKSAALLGDMLELGDYSRLMHDQLGQYVAQTKVHKLFCYGKMADVVAEAAIKHGLRAENVFVSLDTNAPQVMADMIRRALEPGDVLLVKASRAVAAEKVLECLKMRRKKSK